ncbi:MAG TPA: histidinol-phosphate transaminase [Candidatus Methylomirabilis sp.]|nr:histidinol-phosphate transaminase [Candidatus Methylomirabilis sp.]
MRHLWRSVVDKVAAYDAGKPLDRELRAGQFIRLSANESPLGPSPKVVDAIRREAARAHLYPDGGSTELREALGHRLSVAADWIVVGNGADELLGLLARAAYDPGDAVVIPQPSFEPYATEAILAGASVVPSPLDGYETDLDDMRRRVTARTKAVIVCSPHNPASTIVSRRRLEAFLDSLDRDPPLCVVDEAYRDFCDDPDTIDGVDLVRRYPTVVALRTFSKIAGLAGLRVGYAIARPESIDVLNRVRAPYNVNRLAQVAALAALEDTEHLERTRAVVLAERPRLRAALAERGAPSPPSQANFLLVKIGDRAMAVQAALAQSGILVRNGAGVGFPGHLRIAIGTREQNDRLLAAWDHVSERR